MSVCQEAKFNCVALPLEGGKFCVVHNNMPGLHPRELSRSEKKWQKIKDNWADRRMSPPMPWEDVP